MNNKLDIILQKLQSGDVKSLARAISIVENEVEGYDYLLRNLSIKSIPVFGITGPPGAGKSTLVGEIAKRFTAEGKKVAILAVDPTSPFNFGSLLGDRIRMSELFNNPGVYIRSLATRGALGGLSAKTIEITDVLKAAPFDYIFIETVGVGQSEVEIAGLADFTVLVLVPESGDEIQTIKSGIMEIADVFVVNKSDRPDADQFINTLRKLVSGQEKKKVFKVVASRGEGISEIITGLKTNGVSENKERKSFLLAEKAYRLIQNKRMKDVSRDTLYQAIAAEQSKEGFNLYAFVERF